MFGFLNKGPSSKIRVMGHGVDIISIIRNADVIFTGDIVKKFPKDYMEGRIFEIRFETKSGNPYFVYYKCDDYYSAVVGFSGTSSFSGPFKTEEFRTSVSQQIAVFLMKYLKHTLRVDARTDIMSFRHNKAHTNVFAYVASLNNWYAIQHNDSESEHASERKIALVNNGAAKIGDVVAIDDLSPSGD